MKKICKNCQYYREAHFIPNMTDFWCSNSKSPKVREHVKEDDTCPEFYQRGKKAPLWMRALGKHLDSQYFGDQ